MKIKLILLQKKKKELKTAVEKLQEEIKDKVDQIQSHANMEQDGKKIVDNYRKYL